MILRYILLHKNLKTGKYKLQQMSRFSVEKKKYYIFFILINLYIAFYFLVCLKKNYKNTVLMC